MIALGTRVFRKLFFVSFACAAKLPYVFLEHSLSECVLMVVFSTLRVNHAEFFATHEQIKNTFSIQIDFIGFFLLLFICYYEWLFCRNPIQAVSHCRFQRCWFQFWNPVNLIQAVSRESVLCVFTWIRKTINCMITMALNGLAYSPPLCPFPSTR